jgi:hypothetical protein
MSRDSHKQDVTITLRKSTHHKAKVLANQRNISLSGLLAQLIESLIDEEEAYELAERQAIQLFDHGFHLGGLIPTRRDELHER